MQDVSETPLPRLPPRDATSHKGDFGRAIIVGGSRGMPGAPAMSGKACLRSGAGLVTVAVPKGVQATVAALSPCYTTLGLVEDDWGRVHWANSFDLAPLADEYDVWAVGPGLGSPENAAPLVARLHTDWLAPVVIDADGLNAIAEHQRVHGQVLSRPGGDRVLTPHPGEFARLVGDAGLASMATSGDEQRAAAAAELANRDNSSRTVVLLKGRRTVVTDGRRVAFNPTGNPGMATGGSGDVLTGVVTALIAQGLEAFDAARLGAYVHGLAGDLAAESLGQVSLIATDVIDHLPRAFQELPYP